MGSSRGLAHELEGLDGRAARPGSIAVGHNMNRNPRLLRALARHAATSFPEKPALKVGAGFNGATADDQDIGIEGVYHLVEEQTQRESLHAEDVTAEGISLFGQSAYKFCRLVHAEFGQLVAGVVCEEMGQQRLGDGAERAQRLQVAGTAAVALWLEAFDARDGLGGNEHVAEFSAEAHSALDYVAIDDDATTEAGADHDGD